MKHWVFTLGVDKSWREINSFPHYFPFDRPSHIDGIIYSLNKLNKSGKIPGLDIIAFDVRTESFNVIPFPNNLPGISYFQVRDRIFMDSGLVERGGRPASYCSCL